MDTQRITIPTFNNQQGSLPWLDASSVHPRFTGLAQAREDALQWLGRGSGAQPPAATAAAVSTTRVMVGLDVGTAYTKVIAKVGGLDRYAVSFENVVESADRFLLPGVLSVDNSGIAWLGDIPQATWRFDDLKFRVIERDDTAEQDAAFVAFMALALRAARAWLFETKSASLASRKVDWGYNVGMPTLPWEATKFRKKYQKLVEAALLASIMQGPITLQQCRRYVRALPKQATGVRQRICVFPEFAAQITGYVNSPRLREGPHLLVDVGGGTLDVTMFNVFRPTHPEPDGADDESSLPVADTRFPIWDARVERLGSHYLAIARSLAAGDQSISDEIEVGETIETLDRYCARTAIPREAVARMEQQFLDAVAACVAGTINKTRTRRYARFDWRGKSIPTFICGGASRYGLYPDAVKTAAARFPVKLERVDLPVPETLRGQGLAKSLFDRMSVAYGLSFEPLEIGEIVASYKVDDQPREKREPRPRAFPEIDLTDRDQAE